MSVNVILATSDERTAQRVSDLLAESEGLTLLQVVRQAGDVQDVLERTPQTDVLIVDQALDGDHGLQVVRAIGASDPLLGLVVLVEQSGPEQLAAAMDSGARSVISASSSLAEVVARLESVAQWVTAARAAVASDLTGGRGGRVIAVAGAKGGVGTSVVSLLLARGLVASRTVAVTDFDLQSGDLAPYLGVHARRSLVDLVDIAGEMSGRVLREASYEAPGGLRLLSAPQHGERGEEMTARAARSIVSALRFQYDVSVIDVGSHLTEATAVVLEEADDALLVVTPDLPALRSARRVLELWERLVVRTPSSVQVVLNRRARRNEVTEQLAARIVERPVAAVVPDGGAPFEAAMNTAGVAEATGPVHAALAGFADRLVAAPTTSPSAAAAQDAAPAVAPASRRDRRRRQPADAGQSSVELPVAFALALLVFLVCAQGIAWAIGYPLARNAAQEAARTVSVAGYGPATVDRATRDARDELTGPWRSGSTVSVGPDAVEVTVAAPSIVPWLDLRASATASTLPEPS
jgi:pilus assembly protein CpaE